MIGVMRVLLFSHETNKFLVWYLISYTFASQYCNLERNIKTMWFFHNYFVSNCKMTRYLQHFIRDSFRIIRNIKDFQKTDGNNEYNENPFSMIIFGFFNRSRITMYFHKIANFVFFFRKYIIIIKFAVFHLINLTQFFTY